VRDRSRTTVADNLAVRNGVRGSLVRAAVALAALHFPGNYRLPLHDVRRDAFRHRVLSSGFCRRVEVEPACLCRSRRIVDLRCIRFCRFGDGRAAIAHRAV